MSAVWKEFHVNRPLLFDTIIMAIVVYNKVTVICSGLELVSCGFLVWSLILIDS